MEYTNLYKYGLTKERIKEAETYENMFLARIIKQHREMYNAVCCDGAINAALSGKLAKQMHASGQYPAVGDWVMIDRTDAKNGNAVICAQLSRTSAFTRKAAGTGNAPQTVAANIDIVFICMSLNSDFNLRRLERYLTVSYESGATPVLVLTKTDLCESTQEKMREAALICADTKIIACSAFNEDSLSEIKNIIKQGETVAFVGSSGVGKSTIINRLLGSDILKTNEIREGDGKGRHTTTHRELLPLPNGGAVIDTPGMRELQLYTGDITQTFKDIDEMASQCKYSNCTHQNEAGCMIRKALENAALSQERLESYLKLKRELSYEGLNSKQLEQEKITRMFKSKKEYKQARDFVKNKKNRF